jgi:hypothetical protein
MSSSDDVIDPDGKLVEPAKSNSPAEVFELVEQPAKVMRIGGMIRQLLEEVKAAPLDEASRVRLREVFEISLDELKDGLAPELVAELDRLNRSFDVEAPSEAELRVAQAQLVGWLEGLFHGIQAALHAQQLQAQGQLRNMQLALPNREASGESDTHNSGTDGDSAGMYL